MTDHRPGRGITHKEVALDGAAAGPWRTPRSVFTRLSRPPFPPEFFSTSLHFSIVKCPFSSSSHLPPPSEMFISACFQSNELNRSCCREWVHVVHGNPWRHRRIQFDEVVPSELEALAADLLYHRDPRKLDGTDFDKVSE